MENNQDKLITPREPTEKGSLKWRTFLVLIIIIIGGGAYGYFWLQKNNELRMEAEEVIERAQRFEVILSSLNSERDRCEEFISQKEGDFGSFEYCKKFIDWMNSQKNWE
jgi:hypothetical protein